jgi:glycerol uptake facilitator-like aquaporin
MEVPDNCLTHPHVNMDVDKRLKGNKKHHLLLVLSHFKFIYNNIIMNKFIAEFLGTFFFIYVILATGSAVPIGLALAVAIMVLGKFSGGNFNPAVSVMMVAAGKLPSKDLLPYVLAQVVGGLAALELHKRVKI